MKTKRGKIRKLPTFHGGEALVDIANRDALFDAFDAGKDLFGKFHSGRNDLSTNRKAILVEILDEKHRRRSRHK